MSGSDERLDAHHGRAACPLFEGQRADGQRAVDGGAERLPFEARADVCFEQVVGGESFAGDDDPCRADQVRDCRDAGTDRVAPTGEDRADLLVAAARRSQTTPISSSPVIFTLTKNSRSACTASGLAGRPAPGPVRSVAASSCR